MRISEIISEASYVSHSPSTGGSIGVPFKVVKNPEKYQGHTLSSGHPKEEFDIFYDGKKVGTVTSYSAYSDKKSPGSRIVTSRKDVRRWSYNMDKDQCIRPELCNSMQFHSKNDALAQFANSHISNPKHKKIDEGSLDKITNIKGKKVKTPYGMGTVVKPHTPTNVNDDVFPRLVVRFPGGVIKSIKTTACKVFEDGSSGGTGSSCVAGGAIPNLFAPEPKAKKKKKTEGIISRNMSESDNSPAINRIKWEVKLSSGETKKVTSPSNWDEAKVKNYYEPGECVSVKRLTPVNTFESSLMELNASTSKDHEEVDVSKIPDETIRNSGYTIFVSKKKYKGNYYIATAYLGPIGKEIEIKAKGDTKEAAIAGLKVLIVDRALEKKATGNACIDFNVDFCKEIGYTPGDEFYAKIENQNGTPVLIIAGAYFMESPAELASMGFKRSGDRTPKKSTEGTTRLASITMSPKAVANANLNAHGRYLIGHKQQDADGNYVYPLSFHSVARAKNDTLRLHKPALTVGSQDVQESRSAVTKPLR